MNSINRLKKKIKIVISKSNVPEDPIHAQNTLDWLLKLKPDADEALQIAAFGHDIERAMEKRKVRREDFTDYDTFKTAHAQNSARILKEIMQDYNVQPDLVDNVFGLVCCHETGGDPRSNLIRDADSLSFFDVNLPLYFEREGWEETLQRCRWGYQRLSLEMKQIIKKFSYDNDEINELVKTVF
ncbi:MAG: DUF4202 family protein [Deltaproteobacteria bacterium]|nr:DUF4202 family protein [Deltaproteobacteria bacterium]MBW2019840.1 DUF4202 family protein [Deltaproteobacteria bacterium]MBW2074644.1 DUF4202 family protein [Deltaproteobacteria bacterium]RLB80680.1 MAG: hypothetical protein DRH17_11290 [Deltaproteobacteria bacterium]